MYPKKYLTRIPVHYLHHLIPNDHIHDHDDDDSLQDDTQEHHDIPAHHDIPEHHDNDDMNVQYYAVPHILQLTNVMLLTNVVHVY